MSAQDTNDAKTHSPEPKAYLTSDEIRAATEAGIKAVLDAKPRRRRRNLLVIAALGLGSIVAASGVYVASQVHEVKETATNKVNVIQAQFDAVASDAAIVRDNSDVVADQVGTIYEGVQPFLSTTTTAPPTIPTDSDLVALQNEIRTAARVVDVNFSGLEHHEDDSYSASFTVLHDFQHPDSTPGEVIQLNGITRENLDSINIKAKRTMLFIPQDPNSDKFQINVDDDGFRHVDVTADTAGFVAALDGKSQDFLDQLVHSSPQRVTGQQHSDLNAGDAGLELGGP